MHPTAYLVICRRVRHSVEVLHSPTETGLDDWAETVRVSPPTTSNEETRAMDDPRSSKCYDGDHNRCDDHRCLCTCHRENSS